MDETLARIRNIGLVPVVKLSSADAALPLAKALAAGGIPVAEITFRTDAAEEALRRISAEAPDLLLGAGTVLTVDQARRAAKAGARFLVAPAFNPELIAAARDLGLPILPGVSGPDGVDKALALGLEAVKFFPAEASGGLKMLDALAGPYASMRFVPTGGIDSANAGDYLKRPNVLAVGGSWMVSQALIEAGDWAGIERLCREAALAAQGFSFAHVGINVANEAEARAHAALLAGLLGFPFKEGTGSFMGAAIELMKAPYLGSHGHIGIRVNDVERALTWMRGHGIGVRAGTEKREGERLRAAYLELEVSGFAVHLVAQ